jgi:hypothetical protein
VSRRSFPFGKAAALVAAAFLLMVPPVRAGDVVHVPPPPPRRSHPRPSPVPRVLPRPVTISVAVTTRLEPAVEPVYVNIRGPDGVVRRFPIEGGRAALPSPPVVVLRPGESLTIHWQAVR